MNNALRDLLMRAVLTYLSRKVIQASRAVPKEKHCQPPKCKIKHIAASTVRVKIGTTFHPNIEGEQDQKIHINKFQTLHWRSMEIRYGHRTFCW